MDLFKKKKNNGLDNKQDDNLEQHLGFGHYQIKMMLTFFALASYVAGINVFQFLFVVGSGRRKFRCALPDPIEDSFFGRNVSAFDERPELFGLCVMAKLDTNSTDCASPKEKDGFMSTCFDSSRMVSLFDQLKLTELIIGRLLKVPCEFGYIHESASTSSDPQGFFLSLAAELDWVCDKFPNGPNLLMAQGIGYILNSLVTAHFCDSWGRVPVFHIMNLTFIVSRLLLLFTYTNYYLTLIIVAVGSGFFPVGVRLAYVLSK